MEKRKVSIGQYLATPRSAKLSGGVLSWEWLSENRKHSSPRGPLWRKVSSNLWSDFAKLAGAKPERIRAFAGRWGPLRVAWAQQGPPDSERLDRWQYLAMLAQAVLRCSAAIGRGQTGNTSDWTMITGWLEQAYDPGLANPSKMQEHWVIYRRAVISSALNRWYERSSGHTLLGWGRDKIVIAPASTTLFGIVGVQLAYQFVKAAEMLVCHHCQRYFQPERKPAPGVRSFCPKCRREQKPQMYAMRDYRRRKSNQRS